MASALIFNPGSNSLKFELVELQAGQSRAGEARQLASAILDDVGKGGKLSVYEGREIVSTEPREISDMGAAVREALAWLRSLKSLQSALGKLLFAGVRVVHGGPEYAGPAEVTEEVRADIERLEELAPLHNKSSLAVLEVLDSELPGIRQMVAFDSRSTARCQRSPGATRSTAKPPTATASVNTASTASPIATCSSNTPPPSASGPKLSPLSRFISRAAAPPAPSGTANP